MKSEIEKLQAQLDSTRNELKECFKTIATIQDENDKLRKENGELRCKVEAAQEIMKCIRSTWS